MRNVARALILTAALLSVHASEAADPTASVQPDPTGSGPANPNTAPPAADGAQLFATYCATCHKPADLARRLQGAADSEAARAKMTAFLAGHGRSDAQADAAIIDYLANRSAP